MEAIFNLIDLRLLVAFAALFLSLFAIAINRRHKSIDVTMHFQQAYDDLEKLKSDITTEEQANYWFNRFWNLQARQYDYWLRGFIDDELFIYWIRCRKKEYENNDPLFAIVPVERTLPENYTYRNGWDSVKSNHIFKFHPDRFEEFVTGLLTESDDNIPNYIRSKKCEITGWRTTLECWIGKQMLKNIWKR